MLGQVGFYVGWFGEVWGGGGGGGGPFRVGLYVVFALGFMFDFI